MIFITVGNHNEGFERLLKKADELAKDKVIEDVFIQTGYSDYQPRYCSHAPFVEFSEFQDLIKKSHIVITHGGSGTILDAILNNKQIIVVPRLKKFKEHTNDHQLQLTTALEKEGKITAVYDIQDLATAIKKAVGCNFNRPDKEPKIIELIEEYLIDAGLISM